MIVIGVDTHKRSHTLVALDSVSGQARGQLTIAASEEGTFEALRFAAALDQQRVWAVEDCRHVSALQAGARRCWPAGERGDAGRRRR